MDSSRSCASNSAAPVLPVNWAKFFERIPVGAEPAWLGDLARQTRAAHGAKASGPPVLAEKLKTVTPAERVEVATMYMRQQAAQVLAMVLKDEMRELMGEGPAGGAPQEEEIDHPHDGECLVGEAADGLVVPMVIGSRLARIDERSQLGQ